eukprot:m.210051 g.210051  ORF g.210051 m.210051 type:complete len:585 (+) comp22103_c0_seq3:502-2256(+)
MLSVKKTTKKKLPETCTPPRAALALCPMAHSDDDDDALFGEDATELGHSGSALPLHAVGGSRPRAENSRHPHGDPEGDDAATDERALLIGSTEEEGGEKEEGSGSAGNLDAAGARHTTTQLHRMYYSHFLSAWGDRMWQFAIALFLIEIWPDSLLLAAVYGLVSSAATMFFGAIAGHFVDCSPRLRAVRVSLWGQNLLTLVCVVLICVLLKHKDLHDGTFWVLVAGVILSGSASEVYSVVGTLAVEKDWVVVVTKKDTALLSKTNSTLRRIDLSCKILAPLAVGLIMTYAGTLAGALLIGAWNAITFPLEYILLDWVYKSFPELHHKEVPKSAGKVSVLRQMGRPFIIIYTNWKVWADQPVWRAGAALALLYCTVLSFGSIMTAYAYYRGISEAVLSAGRGVGAVFGIGATFLFSVVQNRLGLVKTGAVSIIAQLACLMLCVVSVLPGDSGDGNCSTAAPDDYSTCITRRNVELGFLITGVMMSRLGLWMFDLSVTQLLQVRVPDAKRASINGVESALQNVLGLLGYVFGIALSNPRQWPYLVFISIGFVTAAVVLYLTYVAYDRKTQAPLPAVQDQDEEMLQA